MDRAKTRKPWCLALVPALLLACVGCTAVSGAPGGTPVPVLSTDDAVRQSVIDLGESGVVHYAGSLTANGGKAIFLDLSVTATGEVDGTITVAGQQGGLLAVGGAVYVNATPALWSALSGDPGTKAAPPTGRWFKVPDSTLGMNVATLLDPASIGATLTARGIASGRALADEQTTTVSGRPVIRIPVGDGALEVAKEAPHGIVHLDLPSDLGSATNVSLDVADSSATEAATYQNMAKQAADLHDVVDSGVAIMQGTQTWGPCSAASCTIEVAFTNAGSMPTKVIVDGAWVGDEQQAGACQSITEPVAPGASGTATCTVNSPQWTSFYNQARVTPGRHPYEVDWTTQALAAAPDVSALSAETAGAVGAPQLTGGRVTVYVIDYQGKTGRHMAWKYGVTQTSPWQHQAEQELAACRAASGASCVADQVATAAGRPAADAMVSELVARAKADGGLPPGQWVDRG
jgi:hypothetical protein